MPKPKQTALPLHATKTPRTRYVVDSLLDAGAKFRATAIAQCAIMPNGSVVWVLSNADDVVNGFTTSEFVDILVPLVDTNRLDETVAKALALANNSVARAAMCRAVSEVAIGRNDVVDVEPVADPENTR